MYDGELYFEGVAYFTGMNEGDGNKVLVSINKPEFVGGTSYTIDRIVAGAIFRETDVVDRDYSYITRMTFGHPITGVTGVTSYDMPIQFKKEQSAAANGNIEVSSIYAYIRLRKRR